MTAPPLTPGPWRHVALLGGAFDPPTLGHLDAARFVLEHAPDVHEVWLVPPARHRFAKPMTPAHHRLAMLGLACAGEPQIRPSDYEVAHNLPGDTLTLLSTLLGDRSLAGTHRFSFVIGLDNAETFHRWHRADELRALVPFIVLPRVGVAATAASRWAASPPHRLVIGTRPILPTSSTEARAALAGGASTTHLLHPAVAAYAQAHALYAPHS